MFVRMRNVLVRMFMRMHEAPLPLRRTVVSELPHEHGQHPGTKKNSNHQITQHTKVQRNNKIS